MGYLKLPFCMLFPSVCALSPVAFPSPPSRLSGDGNCNSVHGCLCSSSPVLLSAWAALGLLWRCVRFELTTKLAGIMTLGCAHKIVGKMTVVRSMKRALFWTLYG